MLYHIGHFLLFLDERGRSIPFTPPPKKHIWLFPAKWFHITRVTSHGIVPWVLSNHCNALLRNGVPTLLAAFNRFRGFWSWPQSVSNIGIINSRGWGEVNTAVLHNQSVSHQFSQRLGWVWMSFFTLYIAGAQRMRWYVTVDRFHFWFLDLAQWEYSSYSLIILIIVVFLHVPVAFQPSVVTKCR